MRHRFFGLPAPAVLASVVAVVLAVFLPAAGAAARPAASAAGGTPQAAAAGSGAVFLINGDRLMVTPESTGPRLVAVLPGSTALAGTLVSQSLGGRVCQIPVDALPFLGRGLDPGLFDIGALQGREAGGRLPVQVRYRGRVPTLPGVRITHSGGGTAQGYLTAASARVFGAALARQYLADRGRASYGAGGMFGGGVSVGLPGAAAGRVTAGQPQYPMHTLTIRGTDLAGKPDSGDTVWLLNADNNTRYYSQSAFYHGAAKFSVPAGHYFAMADFLSLSRAGRLTAQRLAVLPQFTVTTSATRTLAARSADSKVTMVTPRPAVPQATELTLIREPAAGVRYIWAFYNHTPATTWITPATAPVRTGHLQVIADAWLTSPPHAASPYEYDLAYQDPAGTIARQRYLVRPAALATVRARYYYAGAPAAALIPRLGTFPDETHDYFPGTGLYPAYLAPFTRIRVPQQRTEYTSTGPSLTWSSELVLPPRGVQPLLQADNVRSYRAGQRVTEDWNGDPLHPGVLDLPAGTDGRAVAWINPVPPSASRAGNTLTLILVPFTDNLPGHMGTGFSPLPGASVTGRYQIDANGVKIAGGDAVQHSAGDEFYTTATLPRGPATVRVMLAAARTGTRYPLPAQTRTVWTWHTARGPAAPLPAGWACPASPACTVQPMLTLRYQLPRMGLDGAAPPGRQVLDVSAGDLQLAHAEPITGVRVAVSATGGASWKNATITRLGAGSYRALYTAPAGRFVTLRVSAADAAGGSITETITRAYRTTS